LAALGVVVGGPVEYRNRLGWRRFPVGVSAQGSDGVEQRAALANNDDAKVFQVLRRQARQDRVVDLVLAECSLVLFEAQVPQPTSEVHDMPELRLARMIFQAKQGV